jgi:serine/threonine protein kinase
VDFYTLGVLFFEMLVGLPPHYNQNRDQMYRDRCDKEVKVPYFRGDSVKFLLEGLLKVNPEERLGAIKGI